MDFDQNSSGTLSKTVKLSVSLLADLREEIVEVLKGLPCCSSKQRLSQFQELFLPIGKRRWQCDLYLRSLFRVDEQELNGLAKKKDFPERV